MRRFLVMTFLACLLPLPMTAHAAWDDAGNPVAQGPGAQNRVAAIPFGAGGVLIAWADARNDAGDVYAQALDANGDPMKGWPANGVALCTAPGEQSGIVLASDEQGGAYLLWNDDRATAPGKYLQRIAADGALAPAWPANGIRVAHPYSGHALAPDGVGGVYVWWGDMEPNALIARLDGSGSVVPGWPVETTIGSAHWSENANLISDGQGGVIAVGAEAWYGTMKVYRFASDGTPAAGWTGSGASVATSGHWTQAVLGSGSDFYACFFEASCTNSIQSGCVVVAKVSHFFLNGTQDPSWPAARLVAYGEGPTPDSFVPDDEGGLMTTWTIGCCARDSYAFHGRITRLGADGQRAPGWNSDSNPICDQQYDQREPAIVPDGGGGALVGWIDFRDNGTPVLYGMRLDSAGGFATGWPPRGAMECLAAVNPSAPRVVATESWHAVVVWVDERNGTQDVYAKPLVPGPEGPPSPDAVTGSPAIGFGIRSVVPNPARGPFRVVLAALDDSPATLDLLDVGGRVLEHRRISASELDGAAILVNPSERRRPGVYWLRFRQGMGSAVRRIVIAE